MGAEKSFVFFVDERGDGRFINLAQIEVIEQMSFESEPSENDGFVLRFSSGSSMPLRGDGARHLLSLISELAVDLKGKPLTEKI